MSEIAARIGKPATSLTRPMAKLIELELVVREAPFDAHDRNCKKSLYRLADPFLAFWFRFVQPHRSLLESAPGIITLDKIRPAFPQHLAQVLETLARRAVPRLAIGDQAWGLARRWWGTAADGQPMEIDVLAESTDRRALLVGEVKLAVAPADVARLKDNLMLKARRLPLAKRYRQWVPVIFTDVAPSAHSPELVATDDLLRALT